MNGESGLQAIDRCAYAGGRIAEGEVHLRHLVKSIFSGRGLGAGLEKLDQAEASLAPRHDVRRKVVDGQTALDNLKAAAGTSFVNLVVELVKDGVGDYVILSGKELELGTAYTVFGRFGVRIGQGQSLAYLHVAVHKHHHNLGCITEILQAGGLGGSVGSLLIHFELDIAIAAVPQVRVFLPDA